MIYMTPCGIPVQTVDPDFFVDENDNDIDWEDAYDYYHELDEIYCGTQSEPAP